jgi:peptidoglycan/LPS O-acetylase OafA/YrhL
MAASLSVPVDRVANVDRLRILAAIGIVWFHTEGAPYRRIGHAGLPIFLLIFFSLIVRNAAAADTGHFLKRRWNRLMVPWLFWSVVYGLCKSAKAICAVDMSTLHRLFSIESLLTGTHMHLWYLPYTFVLGFAMYGISRWTSKVNNIVIILSVTILGVVLLVASSLSMVSHYFAPPLREWNFGIAAVPLGFAIGRCLMIPSADVRKLLLSLVSLVTVIACIVLNWAGFATPAVPYGFAMVLVCLAYSWHAGSDAFVATVAPLTFGIYLIHPLVGLGLPHILGVNQHYAVLIALTVCLSGLITLGLMKTPLRRFV